MFTKAPTLPALVACQPQRCHQPPPPLPLPPVGLLPKRVSGALRADHQLRRHCRTQPQLALPPPLTPHHHAVLSAASPPVAQVLPIKRAAAPASEEDCCAPPPSPKVARRCHPAATAAAAASTCIATNPFYRRRSRGEAPPAPPAPAAPLISGATPSRLFAVADVAFPPPSPSAPFLTLPSSKRDAQTSPLQLNLPAPPLATPLATPLTPAPTPSSQRSGGVSLTNWVRSARCRIAARLRRSMSASRVDIASASSAAAASSPVGAPTPKRLGRRKRHASLQRLVQRLTASPLVSSGTSPTTSSALSSPSGGVSGRVLQLLPDGSRAVRLQRPRGAKFGFFVAKQQDGVHLTRFNDQATQSRYRSVISVGDQILEIEGLPTAAMELGDMHRFISDRRSLLMRVRSPYCSAW